MRTRPTRPQTIARPRTKRSAPAHRLVPSAPPPPPLSWRSLSLLPPSSAPLPASSSLCLASLSRASTASHTSSAALTPTTPATAELVESSIERRGRRRGSARARSGGRAGGQRENGGKGEKENGGDIDGHWYQLCTQDLMQSARGLRRDTDRYRQRDRDGDGDRDRHMRHSASASHRHTSKPDHVFHADAFLGEQLSEHIGGNIRDHHRNQDQPQRLRTGCRGRNER